MTHLKGFLMLTFLGVAWGSGCSTTPCAAKFEADHSPTAELDGGDLVWISTPTQGKQCEKDSGIPLAVAERRLAGFKVIKTKTAWGGGQNLVVPTVCGASDMKHHFFLIHRTDWPKIKALGEFSKQTPP